MGPDNVEAKQPIGMDLQKMNEELIDLLREIADPTKCKLPDGWAKTPIIAAIDWLPLDAQVDRAMDILGRLMRAIEGEGKYLFWRGVPGWQQPYWSLENKDHGTSKKFYWVLGDKASEALALAKCIRAACAVEAQS
jgi:hypothetical protein